MSDTPLDGLQVVVTRAQEQAGALSHQLQELGAIVVEFPTIAIVPPADTNSLDRALAQLGEYDWVIFTSVNGVEQFWKYASVTGASVTAIRNCRVAAIGPATADALRARGVEPELVPEEYVAEAIMEMLPEVQGRRILLPRADIARAVLREELTARGAQVDEVATYRTVPGQPDEKAFAALRAGVDVLTFTSASTVRNFVNIVGDALDEVLSDACVACIGPITAKAAQELGLPVHVVADEYTVEGLVEALVAARGKVATVISD